MPLGGRASGVTRSLAGVFVGGSTAFPRGIIGTGATPQRPSPQDPRLANPGGDPGRSLTTVEPELHRSGPPLRFYDLRSLLTPSGLGEIKNTLCLDPVALANLFSSGIGGAKTPSNTVLLRRPLEPGLDPAIGVVNQASPRLPKIECGVECG